MRRASLLAILVAAASAASIAAGGGGGKTVRVPVPERRQVYVPAGAFDMGLTDSERSQVMAECAKYFEILHTTNVCEAYDAEMEHMAARTVFVSAFWMDRDEVTVADYRGCVAGGGCPLDPLTTADEHFLVPTWPIVNITWSEAQAYCHWRGGALPTEAQWERAARGDDDANFPWGDAERLGDYNHGQPRSAAERELDRNEHIEAYEGDPDASDGAAALAPVGTYPWGEGPYGTRDQAGNAAEWTADAYFATDDHKGGGYDDLGSINPYRAGSVGGERVVRGGSWRQPPVLARSNVRDPYQRWMIRPDHRYSFIGLRCAAPAR